MSVDRLFEYEDEDKQFILAQINKAKNTEKTMSNYREWLARIISHDKDMAYENSRFFTMLRMEDRTIKGVVEMLEKHLG
jgi:hypothetical protein